VAHDISEEIETRLEKAIGVEPTVHMDPVHPKNPMVKDITIYLDKVWSKDDRITDIHDIRVVNTENYHLILFGINVKADLSQKQIAECCQSLEDDLKRKFDGFEINIKVSPLHRY
jgi:divalent metal cation (Fe/Co/Zn/Cd) transporter